MKYKILYPFKDADGIHKPGDPDVDLSDKDAADLKKQGAVEEAADNTVPSDPDVRLAAIVEAIRKLDPENSELWNKDGKPDIAAIAGITGWPVVAAERNAAWETIKPAQA